MAGIVSFGAYIPMYRLARVEIARAWEGGARDGEKAVANWDEDSLTMGVEAAVDCLGGMERELVDGLYFASTTPSYREKQSASIMASGVDLRTDIATADFTNSLRGGASAFKAALDAINAGSAKKMLVVASDSRLPAPASEFESAFGDGAAALLLGDSGVIATVEGSYGLTSDFLDVWRREKDSYSRTWEDRFVLTYGYQELTEKAIKGLLKKYNLKPSDFSKIAVYGPDSRSHAALVQSVGFDPKTQAQNPLLDKVGNTGAALSMMILVAALEQAKPGDRILWASYGDGADAFILKVQDGIQKVSQKRAIKHHLESKVMLPSYEKYLRFRNLLEWEPERRPSQEGSLNIIWRESANLLRGRGQKCLTCGHTQFPVQRICMWCQTRDNFEWVRLSDKKGTIFTFSMDERANVPVLPNVLAAVDLENDTRYFSQVTDRDPAKIEVGMQVELTFRKINEAGGMNNYSWKIRPVR
ncbi:MAG: OB-fold domain-containing protein [Chloroflexi bacterium]|nr:OB-fold domain-containing protein [Chloroflexota bacterium]